MQVQSLETTVETLGHFMLQLIEKKALNEVEIPGDVRRIIQQVGNLDSQRKKPIFVERKIGKSMSVNSQLGFPLKVLEELNENGDHGNGAKTKPAFFENTYQQLRKQNNRLRQNQFDASKIESTPNGTAQNENVPPKLQTSKSMSSFNNENVSASAESLLNNLRNNDSIDSGIATPMSPKENSITSIVETIPSGKNSIALDHLQQSTPELPHPFGNCEEVNFNFSGTTQLKSLRPIHLRSTIAATAAVNEKHSDSRS